MSEAEKVIDLDKPNDAKKFLRGVRIEGKSIDYVKTESGKTINIEEMTPDQLVFYAKEVYFEFCGGVEGEGGVINLETEGMDQ